MRSIFFRPVSKRPGWTAGLPGSTASISFRRSRVRPNGGSLDPWWAIRKGDWKLVGNKGKTELYNLRDDIGESRDLASDRPDLCAELRAMHDAWLASMKEPVNDRNHKRWTPGAPSKGDLKKQKTKANRKTGK